MGKAKTRDRHREETIDAGHVPQDRRAWSPLDFDAHLRPQGRGYVPVRSYQVPADRHE